MAKEIAIENPTTDDPRFAGIARLYGRDAFERAYHADRPG